MSGGRGGSELSIRLLAGSWGGERDVPRARPDDPRWFEPLHVKDPRTARRRIADQVLAGADVVAAPTWRTHRRALLPLGETRRAREWTEAAVRVTREGVESGLELRAAKVARAETATGEPPTAEAEAAAAKAAAAETATAEAEEAAAEAEEAREAAPEPTPEATLIRPPVLVAGILPELDAEPDSDHGRLLPRDAASERDYASQAGLLAESDVDLILIEGPPTLEGSRVAVEAAAATGLPTWVQGQLLARGTTLILPDGTPLEEWATTVAAAGTARVIAGLSVDAVDAGEAGGRLEGLARGMAGAGVEGWGVSLTVGARPAESGLMRFATETLAVGATVLALTDGATPKGLALLRAILDDRLTRESATLEARAERWRSMVLAAAGMTEGGHAVWVGPRVSGPLPSGFDWLVVDAQVVPILPREHFRLVAAADVTVGAAAIRSLLAQGGVAVVPLSDDRSYATGLRVVRDADGEPALAILRRDPD